MADKPLHVEIPEEWLAVLKRVAATAHLSVGEYVRHLIADDPNVVNAVTSEELDSLPPISKKWGGWNRPKSKGVKT